MQYTLMFYMSPSEFSARTDPNRKADFWGAFLPYMHAVRAAGIFKGGAGLEPPDSATTVRVQNGKRSVQDGPYADTKEQLGGFFIIDVHLLTRMRRVSEAAVAYNRAIGLCEDAAMREFLRRRMQSLISQ